MRFVRSMPARNDLAKRARQFLLVPPLLALALGLSMLTAQAAAPALTQQVDPPEVNVGDTVVVTLTVQNGNLANVQVPPVDGLQLQPGISTSSQVSFVNGSLSSSTAESFRFVPTKPGDFIIPAFDVQTQDGQTLHVHPIKIHALDNGMTPSRNATTTPIAPAPAQVNPADPFAQFFNRRGPVVIPPANANPAPAQPGTPDNATDADAPINVPTGPDGRPAKVFVIITPETTDAYVGQAIPLRIDWYIRLDVDYQQNSLPTIKGSDFLMNNLSIHPAQEERIVMNEAYRRESWLTAISAPKSGDFPLQMERDSYWIKSNTMNTMDPIAAFFSRPTLGHQSMESNKLTIHVNSLPTEGRPANFTGAIGQLQVSGSAQPDAVSVGDPVTLRFTVEGEGNFDYVRCPSLAPDAAWKAYTPSSKIEYRDESHTQAVKSFEQAVIPQKNGVLPLPAASFSYFDPKAKQYVTVPVNLSNVTVTGSITAAPAAPASSETATTSTPVAPKTPDLLPNRLEFGSLTPDLTPVYRKTWFWALQGIFLGLVILGGLVLGLRARLQPQADLAQRDRLQTLSLQQEQDAMSAAASRGDAVAFFLSARHALQLHLGRQWAVRPEAVNLDLIRVRDPELAERLGPLFAMADEIIYSGQTRRDLDLADWLRHVREVIQLQPQPA